MTIEQIIRFRNEEIAFGTGFFHVSFHTYCLQLLDLSRNNLNGFDDNQVWKLRQIKDVKLENNPLVCDRCHMGALISTDIIQTVRIILYYTLGFKTNQKKNRDDECRSGERTLAKSEREKKGSLPCSRLNMYFFVFFVFISCLNVSSCHRC